MTEEVPSWFPYAFPFFFIGLWLLVSTMLGFMSGWFDLQQWYADERNEEPLLKLGWQSGSMGLGVSLGGILTLGARRSGLSVRIWRIFGPFQRPLLIPWSEIEASEAWSLFTPRTRLRFGSPPVGRLTISTGAWSKLVDAAKPTFSAKLSQPRAIDRRSAALRMLLEWLAVTAFAAAFFYFGSRLGGDAGLPLATCILFPAIVFGIGQLVRYAREN